MVNAITNLFVQAVRKLEQLQCLSARELGHWSHYAKHTARVREQMLPHLGVTAKRVILTVAHGGATPRSMTRTPRNG